MSTLLSYLLCLAALAQVLLEVFDISRGCYTPSKLPYSATILRHFIILLGA